MWWSECLILDLTLDFSTNEEAGPPKHFSATNGINPTTTTTYSPTISDEFTNIHSFDQSTVTSKSSLSDDLPSLKNEPSTSHFRMKLLHHKFLTLRITKLLCWHISARNRKKPLPLLFNPHPSRTVLPAQLFPLQAPLFCTIITFQWPQMTRLPFWQTLFLIWRTWRQQYWSRESLQTV